MQLDLYEANYVSGLVNIGKECVYKVHRRESGRDEQCRVGIMKEFGSSGFLCSTHEKYYQSIQNTASSNFTKKIVNYLKMYGTVVPKYYDRVLKCHENFLNSETVCQEIKPILNIKQF